MTQNEVALDFLLEGFIDDALIEQCRGITINALVQDNRKARSGDLFIAHQGYNTHGLLYAPDAVAKVSVLFCGTVILALIMIREMRFLIPFQTRCYVSIVKT
jgi:hypothetical protein